MWWLRYLLYRHRYIPAGKRGMTHSLGTLPYKTWVWQQKNLRMQEQPHQPKPRKYSIHQTSEWSELTIWRALYSLPRYKLRFRKIEAKYIHKPDATHLAPELTRWLPGDHWKPGGWRVTMSERLGRQRAVRFMMSRSLARYKLAQEACFERAHAYARVSTPLKKGRK